MGKRKEDTVIAERVAADQGRCGMDEGGVAADLFGVRRHQEEGRRGTDEVYRRSCKSTITF